MQIIDWSRFLKKGLLPENKQLTGGLPTGSQLVSSMTVGVFDGVHRGHQALIRRVVSYNANNMPDPGEGCSTENTFVPVVVTFRENHKSKRATDNILSFRQKIAMFENLGIKITIVIDFTETFRHMTGLEFLEKLYKHANIGFFAVGSRFRCGYQQDTGAQEIGDFFTSRNIPVEIIPEVMEGSLPISSSRIRRAITDRDFPLAETMLGYQLTHSPG
uniref:FAD synthase n=1 Tax=uncultured bacterium contig00031 TaxID=1181520 RepID=A0A806K076_9BACT|nr:riboflavin kinase / FMN adenylyltransferase [uncultured bacterium contig00031]